MLLSLLGFVALENAVCVMEQAKLRLYRRVRQKGEHRAAKISEIIRDLQEIQEKYGDVGVYVNPWAEAVNRPVIAAKSSFVDEAGSIQAVIIA